ncbi:MAG: M56 family metallopeptidase [Eubacteriales bacterium]|nr:M56 family metallopeptidase [Eubacteriales bacterium]
MSGWMGEINRLAFGLAPIFYKLVWMSLTAVMIGFIVLLLRYFGEKRISPLWKYLLWAVMLFALLVPYRFPSSFSLMPISIEQEVSYRQSYEQARQERNPVNRQVEVSESAIHGKNLGEKESRLFWTSLAVDVILPWIWFAGMMVWAIYFMVGRWRFLYQVRKDGRLLSSDSPEMVVLSEAKKKLGITREVDVLVQSRLQSPALFTGRKPLILLPEYAQNLREESLLYILMHELAHWKRKDHWLNYLLLCLQVVYWFNPLVWLLFLAIRNDMEVLNDEYVLKQIGMEHQKRYSYSLVEVLAHANHISGVPKLLCMVDGKKNVERRIKMMQQGGYFQKSRKSIAIMGGVMILTLAILFLTQMPPQRESMKWAKNLKMEEIEKMELLVTPAPQNQPYRLFEREEWQEVIDLIHQSRGKYLANPEELAGQVITLYVTTKDGKIHHIGNLGNAQLVIDGDHYQSDYDWLSGWKYREGNVPLPKYFHYGKAVSTFKGLEIYLGKEDGKTYYNLLSGTNREKTEEEKYNPATAESNLGEVIKFISKQGEGLHVWLIPDDRLRDSKSLEGGFSELEVDNIAMQLREALPKDSTLEVVMPETVGKVITLDAPAETVEAEQFPVQIWDKITFSFFQDTGKRPLTPAEVEEVGTAFEQLVQHPEKGAELFVNPVCHFFNSYYDKPEEMDLWEFTWYLPGEELLAGNETDETEFAKLKESGVKFFADRELKDTITPLRRVPRAFVDSMLTRYMGIVSQDITKRGETLYLGEPYDNFYIFSSDMGVGFFECTGGEINGEELRLFSDYAVLTLKRVNDRYLIVSHRRKGE